MNQPEYFFVTSYGRTATLWLTRALNLHPDIVCSHGPSFIPIIACQGMAYTEQTVVNSQNSAQQFSAQTLRQVLRGIETQGKACWVGNVHGFTARNLWIRGWTEPGIPPFRSVNLLRHPVTRVHSFWRRWQYERGFDSPVTRWIATEALKKHQYRNVIKELRRYHDVALINFEERAFFYAVMQMSGDHRDLRIGTTQILCEKLVNDMDYFAYTLKMLMGEDVPLPAEYLRRVEQLGRQNESEGSSCDADRVFKEWQPWQRTLFMMFLRDHPKLKAQYLGFGYKLPHPDSSPVEISKKSRIAQISESLRHADAIRTLYHIGRTIGRSWELTL